MTKKTPTPPLAPPPPDDDSSSGEDSHIELHRPPSGVTKPKKEWVYTEARKAAFERARAARQEMGNTKKQIIETKAKLREVKKEKLTKLKGAVEMEVKKSKKLEKKLAPSSDEESEAPELPRTKSKKAKKAKKVKQVMYYDSDSTSSSEDEGRRSKKPVNVVIHNGPSSAPPDKQAKVAPRVGLFI